MVTARGNQGNHRPGATRAAVHRCQLLTAAAAIVAAYLVTSANCLPTSLGKHGHSDGRVLLTSAVSEFEDALSRLKLYAKSLSAEADRSIDQEDDDPLAESVERVSRDEDYRQEPEIVPGLDRFEKNLVEAAGSSGRTAQKSGGTSSKDEDDLNDISIQDLLNFYRETVKDRKKEGESRQNEPVARSTTKLPTASASEGKSKGDISLKDLMEFLNERKSQKNNDRSDVTLKDALEYIGSLKKKLSENERTE